MEKPAFRAVTLPDGRSGRSVGIRFLPHVDEDLYLTATNVGQLSGYSQNVQFSGSLNGESLAAFRMVRGTYFFPLVTNSLGTANGPVRLGAVVITEIMYHPPIPSGGGDPDSLEFIEIQNTSHAAVDVSGWEMDGVSYEFPAGQTIAAGGVLVVVPFGPVTDTAAIANFDAAYSVRIAASQQQYLGPHSGRLTNSGERITLCSWDDPPAGTSLKPLIFEDGVEYDDVPPWPGSADGAGDSLQRTSANGFGDSAGSWMARSDAQRDAVWSDEWDVMRDLEHESIGGAGTDEGRP